MRQNVNTSNYHRLNIVFFVILISYSLVLVKLFSLQIINHSYWSQQAKAQQTGNIKIYASRGEIFSSDNSPLVLNSYSYDLIIDPSKTPDDFKDIEELFKIIYKYEFDKKVYERDLNFLLDKERNWKDIIKDNDRKYAILEKNVSIEVKNLVENKKYPWVYFSAIPSRSYPEKEYYSHILGFVGRTADGTDIGYYGLEGFYNGDLKGVDGWAVQEISADGSPILIGDFDTVQPINGSSLKLTIDRTIQSFAYEEIKDAVEKFKAESGTVIIVEPSSGRVLSIANFPTYNPEDFSKYSKESPKNFTNKATSSLYEPGSVIKALTMSAAIDMKRVSPSTTVDDIGPVYYSGHMVDNWDKKHHNKINMTQVLQLSNNIGAAWVGDQVGREKLYDYFYRFNLGQKTGVDLEGEETGTIRNYRNWQDIDLAAASFGQGISATPLQVAMAFSAIANNGLLMKPYLVEEIQKDGKTFVNKATPLRQVMREESAQTMVQMLTEAVSGGEAKYFVSKKYYVAGKTGTAQIAEEGKYLADKTNATFVGFLPSYKEFVMLVKLEKPTVSIYASETAVPVWMNIAEKLANYKGLPPDRYD